MLKAYLSVICASLILADTRGYHVQLSMVTSYIDMISVIFIKGKLLKLHAPMSIHATSISLQDLAKELLQELKRFDQYALRWLVAQN